MKSILKLFLFMSIILISKYTKENEIATASATMKTSNVRASFTNFQQKVDKANEKEESDKKAAEVVY